MCEVPSILALFHHIPTSYRFLHAGQYYAQLDEVATGYPFTCYCAFLYGSIGTQEFGSSTI